MTPQISIFNDSMTVGEAIEMYLTRSRLGFYDRHYYIYYQQQWQVIRVYRC